MLSGPSPQVAYVVSWLNEAQMKARSTPGPSGASWDSWDSIGAAKYPLLSLAEVGGLGLGSIHAGTRFPSSAPDSKRHAHTLQGERNVRAVWLRCNTSRNE